MSEAFDWVAACEELVELTWGITKEDPKLPRVLALLDGADQAYLDRDEVLFRMTRAKIAGVMCAVE